mmetsp:Transcript_41649/g.107787  ORF Transcript_41649/g.107787 Transcript_41649/m.107787 type:complete len:102 (-) Transcript_41649:305-610(-)
MDQIAVTSLRASLIGLDMQSLSSSCASSPCTRSPVLSPRQGVPLMSLPCLAKDRQLDDPAGMGLRRYTPLNLGGIGRARGQKQSSDSPPLGSIAELGTRRA